MKRWILASVAVGAGLLLTCAVFVLELHDGEDRYAEYPDLEVLPSECEAALAARPVAV